MSHYATMVRPEQGQYKIVINKRKFIILFEDFT